MTLMFYLNDEISILLMVTFVAIDLLKITSDNEILKILGISNKNQFQLHLWSNMLKENSQHYKMLAYCNA